MASITGNNNIVVISGGNSAFVFDKNSSNLEIIEPPKPEGTLCDEKGLPRKGETSSEHADKHMASISLSNCGQYLALASSRGKKSLYLWHFEGKSWKFISQRPIGRAASKIRFTHSASAVLVADKAGDVYSFSVTEPEKEKEWLLGHIAMLLDVLVVDDEDFIITCDRDDKIRVARFPNCYNIHSYCLGHTSFVTNLALLPHNNKILISTSGDGTMKLWNYLEGKLLLTVSLDKFIPPPCDGPMPIKHCSTLKLSEDSSLLCVSIGGMAQCAIFKIEGNSEPCIKYTQILSTGEDEIWWTHFTADRHLYALKNSKTSPVCVWTWDDALEFRECSSKEVSQTFDSHANTLQECFTSPSIPAMLYRKIYDEPPPKARKKK